MVESVGVNFERKEKGEKEGRPQGISVRIID